MRRGFFIPLAFMLLVLVFGSFLSFGADRLKLGSDIKDTPVYYLPVLAAEERGLWKENGLEVEYVPFRSSVDHFRAITARAVMMGMSTGLALIEQVSRGVPAIMVSNLQEKEGVALYSLPSGPIKEPKDLKGGRIGITRLGSTDHANGRLAAKIIGIDKDVRFIATGGISEKIAALRSGVIDAMTIFVFPIAELKSKGEVKELMRLYDYFPKPWVAHNVVAHKDFVKSDPRIIKNAVRAILQATEYIRKNRAWVVQKMMSNQNYSEATAEEIYQFMYFSEDGRVKVEALKNLQGFVAEYEIIPREKIPRFENLYTAEFTG